MCDIRFLAVVIIRWKERNEPKMITYCLCHMLDRHNAARCRGRSLSRNDPALFPISIAHEYINVGGRAFLVAQNR